jgi:AcrR family transcriptional regulator
VTVTSILEAADRVLRSDGYDAASTNRLARVAGFSVGSLYQYFSGKQAVVGALIDRELIAEAEAIARAIGQRGSVAPAEVIDEAVGILLTRRTSRAHLYRTLDAHHAELGAPVVLSHLVAAQAPALSELLQRIGAQGLPRAGRSVDAQIYALSRAVSELAYAYAVDAPPIPQPQLRRVFAAGAERYLAHGPASDPARALVAGWVHGPNHAATRGDARGRRRREARSWLLVGGMDPSSLEPITFALSCLAEVALAAQQPPPCLTTEIVCEEVSRLADALRG